MSDSMQTGTVVMCQESSADRRVLNEKFYVIGRGKTACPHHVAIEGVRNALIANEDIGWAPRRFKIIKP